MKARRSGKGKACARHVESVCSSGCSSVCSCSSASSRSSHRSEPAVSRSYRQIRRGLRKSIQAAIVLYAFHKLPESSAGLSSRQVISILKKKSRVIDDPRRTGKSIDAMLRCALEFGLLEKREQKYFLARQRRSM